ncbi:MAG: hypothetical protein ABGZ53_06030 [Fuerstiella sp.]
MGSPIRLPGESIPIPNGKAPWELPWIFEFRELSDSTLDEHHDFYTLREEYRRSGGLPMGTMRELLRWWIELSPAEENWHHIAPARETDSAIGVKYVSDFRKGLAHLAVRGLLACRSLARFITAEPGTKVVECVCDWGGAGQSCEKAVRRELQKRSIWPSGWDSDGHLTDFMAVAIAVRKTKVNFRLTGTVDEQVDKLLDRFPNTRFCYPSKLRFIRIDDIVVDRRKLDYWLDGGSCGTPIKHPFGENASTETSEPEAGRTNVLRKDDPIAKDYRYENEWMTEAFAIKRFNLKKGQLHKASRKEQGLFGVPVRRLKAQTRGAGRRSEFVFHIDDVNHLVRKIEERRGE